SDGTTLNVTLGGLNALARLDMTKNFAVKSVVPTGWFPIAMGRLGDTLVVANSKGIGGRAQSPASHMTSRGLRAKDEVFYIHNNIGTVQFLSERDLKDNRNLVAK